jgi:6-phosphogluconolactonase
MQNDKILTYIGTYTRGESEGIYIYRLDLSSGALEHAGTVPGVSNPSFLAIDSQQRYLYAADEDMEFQGRPGGAVSAFAIDPHSGGLTFLNQQPTHGGAPCHLVVDSTGRYVLLANYMGGNLAVYPIQGDGSLGPASHLVQHEGASINPERQDRPHAHSINLDPANRFAFAPDLGLDKVMIYRLDLDAGKLIPNQPPWAQVQAGAGPRHFTFHPNGNYAYLINEIDSTITVFAYDAGRGALAEIQTTPTLPADFTGKSTTADIHVHPSGKFLYGSNRGHDSLAIFAIDETTGKLTFIGHESTQGQTPRNFAIAPGGTFLLAANQRSDNIVTFRINQETGQLTPTGHIAQAPMPVCIKFLVKN